MRLPVHRDPSPFELFDIDESFMKMRIFLDDVAAYFKRERFWVENMDGCLCEIFGKVTGLNTKCWQKQLTVDDILDYNNPLFLISSTYNIRT